jgi:hypothetical protein
MLKYEKAIDIKTLKLTSYSYILKTYMNIDLHKYINSYKYISYNNRVT